MGQVMRTIVQRLNSRRWLWGSVVATGLIGIAGIAVWAGRSGGDDLLEDMCSPPVASAQQAGCVATIARFGDDNADDPHSLYLNGQLLWDRDKKLEQE